MPANPTLDTNYYDHAVAIGPEICRDEVLVFTGAGTVLKGTLLGRITASGKLKPFAAGNNDGSQSPVAIMQYEVIATGAGDVAVRPLVKGDVNRNRLILAADGNGNNITPAMLDQLRDYGLTPVDVQPIGQVV